jgi:RNA recognition motif-containing protein
MKVSDIQKVVASLGFADLYDVLRVPTNRPTSNLGYAFINFKTNEQAERFKEYFNGFKDWQMPCDKVCETSWSDNLQGRSAFVERYRDSPMMHESVADKFKPALYQDGIRVPFPEPTKAIKSPRPRQRNRGCAGKAASEVNRSCEITENMTTDKEDTADVM